MLSELEDEDCDVVVESPRLITSAIKKGLPIANALASHVFEAVS